MPRIIIEKIGPIKRPVDIDLKRINVFIGPQGSGKSTVAKLVSFCLWLEKDCVKRQLTSHVDKAFVDEQLVQYHNLAGYFSDESHFLFQGDAIDVELNGNDITITRKDAFAFLPDSKMAYIPAERSVVSVPGIFSTKMPDNYIRDYIHDWLTIREYYSRGSNADEVRQELVPILNLGQYYSFNSVSKTDEIVGDSHDNPFALSQVSSGLQAVTPICVMVNFLTDWVYSHTENRSPEEVQAIRRAAFSRIVAKKKGIPNFNDIASHDKKARDIVDQTVDIFLKVAELNDDDLKSIESEGPTFMDLVETLDNLKHPSMSNIIIEEPELNLFPTTQVEMVKFLLGSVNHDRDRLIITTHSPYLLYGLNNCMLAEKIAEADADAAKDIETITGIAHNSWTNARNVAVWEMGEGGIRGDSTIQDEDGLIRDNYFDRAMQNVMADFRNLLSLG